MDAARSRLQDVFKQSTDKELDASLQKLTPILLDLANYEDEDLVQGSLQLLDKLYSSELNLFQRALQAQLLITEESKELHAEINCLLHSLKQYLNPKVSLHSKSASQSLTSDEEAMSPVIIKESPLKKLTDKCWLQGEVEGFEPHQQNQSIIYNFGESLEIRHNHKTDNIGRVHEHFIK